MERQFDNLDLKILGLLATNARESFQEIARVCDLSGAAIHQRIQKLRNLGVIKGSEFIIDNYKVGYMTCAYIGIVLSDIKKFNSVVTELKKIPEVVECHYATGKYSMFIKIYARDNRHLLQIILEHLTLIDGVQHTETFQLSLDEIFNRQLSVYDVDDNGLDDEEQE